MNFSLNSSGFAKCEVTIPFWRQPFCTLDLLAIGRGARTAFVRRRASLQNDSPLGVPNFSTGLSRTVRMGVDRAVSTAAESLPSVSGAGLSQSSCLRVLGQAFARLSRANSTIVVQFAVSSALSGFHFYLSTGVEAMACLLQ